jgi:hypothetical protein
MVSGVLCGSPVIFTTWCSPNTPVFCVILCPGCPYVVVEVKKVGKLTKPLSPFGGVEPQVLRQAEGLARRACLKSISVIATDGEMWFFGRLTLPSKSLGPSTKASLEHFSVRVLRLCFFHVCRMCVSRTWVLSPSRCRRVPLSKAVSHTAARGCVKAVFTVGRLEIRVPAFSSPLYLRFSN